MKRYVIPALPGTEVEYKDGDETFTKTVHAWIITFHEDYSEDPTDTFTVWPLDSLEMALHIDGSGTSARILYNGFEE